jgi:hypothetical protein
MPINVPPHKEKSSFWRGLLGGLMNVAGAVFAGPTGGASLAASTAGNLALGLTDKRVNKTAAITNALGQIAGILNMSAGKQGKQIGLDQTPPPDMSTPTQLPEPNLKLPNNSPFPSSDTSVKLPEINTTIPRSTVGILSQNNPGVNHLQLQDALSASDSLPLDQRNEVRPTLLQAIEENRLRLKTRFS